MPSWDSDVLPATPGLNLGSPSQPWNAFIGTYTAVQSIFGQGAIGVVSYSPIPTFNFSTSSVLKITLTGNVTSSTMTTTVTGVQFIMLRIVQDATGGRSFVWPSNMYGVQNIDNINFRMNPNQILQQMFIYDSASGNAYALAPAMLF